MTVAPTPVRVAIRASFPWTASAVLAFAVLVVTAQAGGAFFPSTWGWSALGPLLAALAALTFLDRIELGRADAGFLALLAALLLWTGLSAVWSDSVPRSISEVERDLVYLGAVAALLLLTTRREVHALVVGVFAGTTAICGFGLATRLFPDRYGLEVGTSSRLARPLGYWNGMGLLASIGMLIALGLAVSARNPRARAAAAGAIPVLGATLYFTFSRGSWMALLLGVAVALTVTRDRARLVAQVAVLAPVLVAAVWACSSFRALNEANPTLTNAARDGHRLAPLLLTLALAAAVVPHLVERCARGLRVPRAAWRALLISGCALALAAGALAVTRNGGPYAVWHRLGASFGASGWSPSTNLDDRLFNVSGRGRGDYWRVAWAQASSHPWLGSGAGTFDLYWTHDRPLALGALDAHSLYLETLAELGPVGLALLCVFLAVPLAALRRARALPVAPAVAGAYAAFLLAAGVDWHWELPTVTLAALSCAAALVVSARGPASARSVAGRRKRGAIAVIIAIAGIALVVQIGNTTIDAGRAAVNAGSYRRAAADARRATWLAPWSSAPWSLLATVQQHSGDLRDARASLRHAVAKDPNDWRLWYQLAGVSAGPARHAALAEARRLNPLGLPLTSR
jgi:tetratricopeptide (TPR) repeat protein